MRKDRYSALEYAYMISQELVIKEKPRTEIKDLVSALTIRSGKRASEFD